MRHSVDEKLLIISPPLKKAILSLLFLIFLLQPIVGSTIANANYDPVITENELEPTAKPGLVEKHLSKFVLNVANTLIGIAKAQDVSVLVFQREEVIKSSETWVANTANATRDDMVFGIFPTGLFDGISVFYDLFKSLLTIPIAVLLSLGGLLLLFDVMRSAESKNSAKEMVLGVIIAILFLRFGHIAWDWIIFINYIIVDGVFLTLEANGIYVTSFISTIWDPSSTESVTSSPSFTIAIIVMAAAIFTFTMNYQYMMRMIILALLIILFPPVLLGAIMPSRRSVLNTWFTEFTSQTTIQAAHAIALGLFFFAIAKANDLGIWFVIVMFFALPAISDLVQRFVAALTGEGGGGGLKTSFQNASGIGGLMAVASIGKGIMGRQGSGGKNNATESFQSGREAKNDYSNSAGADSASPIVSNGSSIGPAPISSGSGSRPRGLARLGNGIASTSKRVANSQGLRKGTVAATAVTAALAGGAIGTMTTGRPSSGMATGAIAGGFAGNIAGYGGSKIAKGTQIGGEVLQSKSQGGNAFDVTKERLGYHETSQLSDSSEMARMGSELLGGRTGAILGSATGSASYYTDKFAMNGSDLAKERYEAVNEKRDLGWDIGQQSVNIQQLGKEHQIAEAGLNAAYAKHGGKEAVGRNLPGDVVAAKERFSKVDNEYKKAKYQQMQSQQKHDNYHAIKSHAKETKNLQNQRLSSGAI